MDDCNHFMQRTDDGVLKFTGLVDVEQLAGAQRELHALVILLQLIVNLGSNQSSQFPLREVLVLV